MDVERPRNISTQLYQDIINIRDAKETILGIIDKFKKNLATSKSQKEKLQRAKEINLNKKIEEIRKKIMLNELKKHRYLNLIDVTCPLKLDQFAKFEGSADKSNEIKMLSQNVSQGILVTTDKLEEQLQTINNIKNDNNKLVAEKQEFSDVFNRKHYAKETLLKQVKIKEAEFVSEQILKFGTTIKFEYLLKAAKDTTVLNYFNIYYF